MVLILVLVEHTLGAFSDYTDTSNCGLVLILVLVEHTLGVLNIYVSVSLDGLNPCFSGTYSRSPKTAMFATRVAVLILVLVEHTLGALVSICKAIYAVS